MGPRGIRALAAAAIIAGMVGMAGSAAAQYYKKPISDLDPSIMVIDEKAYLGAKMDGNTPLVRGDGREFSLSDLLGRPLVLVLAYYSCDGSCSIINHELATVLEEVTGVTAGEDFRILTLSFDKLDTRATTVAFRDTLEVRADHAAHWTFATFKDEADLEAQTAKIGFKFFWSPEDRVFLHPGAFLFLSPEGRLIRILYPPEVEARDFELAVFDAKQGQFRPQEIIDFAISLCYSYNFKEGKYTLSIPVFVGVGALLLGITMLFTSIVVFKHKRRFAEGGRHNGQTV